MISILQNLKVEKNYIISPSVETIHVTSNSQKQLHGVPNNLTDNDKNDIYKTTNTKCVTIQCAYREKNTGISSQYSLLSHHRFQQQLYGGGRYGGFTVGEG